MEQKGLFAESFSANPDDVKKIIVDPVSHEVHLILPIFPLGKRAKPPDDFAIHNDFDNAYNELQRAIGKADLTLMKTLDNKFAHPRNDALSVLENYKMQSNYSLGKLEYIFPKPDKNNVVWGSYNVVDPIGKKVVLKYKDSYNKGVVPFFTSSQIARESTEDPHNVKKFDLMHTTLTDGPAFGEELSRVGGVCQGDIKSCVFQYGAASNTVSDIGMNIHGDVIDVFHTEGNCPFCVETELTNLFENNLKNSDYILNSASKASMPNNEEQKGGVIKPDEDQSSTSRAPIDVETLSDNVAKKVAELTKANEVTSVEEAKNKTKDNEVTDKKDIDVENPKVKALEELVKSLAEKVESFSGTVKEKEEKLSVLESKANEVEIGDLLAAFEFNFYDPDTGKADPARWEAAFKFAKEHKLTPTELKMWLETMSPYGMKPRKMEPIAVTNKASLNRGVPKYNSAFEGKEPQEEDQGEGEEEGGTEEKKIHSASTNRVVPKYMGLLRSVVRDNNLE